MVVTLKKENTLFNFSLLLVSVFFLVYLLSNAFKPTRNSTSNNNYNNSNSSIVVAQDSIGSEESKNNFEETQKDSSISEKLFPESENSNITTTQQNKIPALPEELEIVTPNAEGYKITGMGKKQSTIISIPFEPNKIPSGYLVADIRTFRYDYKIKQWEELQKEGIDPEKNLLYSRTHSDGLMINGIIKSPELPQTDNYTPTRIRDLKLADPGSNVQLIESPVANQQGSARLSYNIEVPKGRNGIEPDLKITYSSDGGNGLLGEGWDLHIPTISVETRWGVPTYDPTNETETYLLDGEMLAFENDNGTALAHRNLGIKRNTSGDKQFFKRKQTDYNTIIRHGNKPTDYWWEVIDNKGTKFFYGLKKTWKKNSAGEYVSSQTIDENALLSDASHNYSEWRITRVEDVFGNIRVYEYPTKPVQNISSITITNTYPTEIFYSSWEKEKDKHQYPFNYKVELKYIDNPNFNYSARYGFFTGNLKLIDEIIVSLNETNDNSNFSTEKRIRSYKFNYDFNTPFGKPLLTKLTQFGTDGKTEFNHHSFEYYNDISNGLFSSPASWNSSPSNLSTDLLIPNKIPNVNPTDIGGSKSSGNGFSFYAGVGLNDFQICNRNVTVGIQFGFNSSSSEGLNTLIDIDGDGLPDKVFVIGNDLWFRKNTGTGFSGEKHKIGGRYQFFEESSSTNSFGVSAYFGASVSLDNSSTESDITTYFSDVNADGLVDIVTDGRVWFNHIDANGIPSFSDNSNGTSQPITGGTISVTDNINYTDKSNERAKDNPQHDVVRVWEAPFKGVVNIKAPAALLNFTPTGPDKLEKFQRKFLKADGVVITIQKAGVELVRQSILKDDYSEHPINLDNISVNAGEKIYFRVMSGNDNLSNADFDNLSWSPKINYLNDEGNPINTANRYDVFGQNLYQYGIENDFLFASEAGFYPDKDRKVNIAMPFKKDITSNDIRVQIIQLSENLNDPVFIEDGITQVEVDWTNDDGSPTKKKLFHYSDSKLIFDTILTASKTYSSICPNNIIDTQFYKSAIYLFRILSDVNTEFKKITWEPSISFYNPDRNKTETIFVIPDFQIRGELSKRGEFWTAYDSTNYSIEPFLKFKTDSLANANVWFTIRKDSTIVDKRELNYQNGVLTPPLVLDLSLSKDQEYFATFESDTSFRRDNLLQGANWIIKDFANFDGRIEGVGNSQFKANSTGKYIFSHNLIFNSKQKQKIEYTIYKNNVKLKKGIIDYPDTILIQYYDTISLTKNDAIYIRYDNFKTPIGVPASTIVASQKIKVSQQIGGDVWYKRLDGKFGPMYRNWGQFAYKDKKDGTVRPIDESKLIIPKIDEKRRQEIKANVDAQLKNTNPADISNLKELDKKNFPLNTLVPCKTLTEYQWKGMNDEIFINQSSQSSSRVGFKEVKVESPFIRTPSDDGKAFGIIKRTSSENVSKNVGMVASKSNSSGKTFVESDYLDLNGDRFPDIISSSNTQLTKPNGTLGNNLNSVILTNSTNESSGLQIGGSYSTSISGNSGTNPRVGGSSSVNSLQNGSGSITGANQSSLNIGASGAATSGSDLTQITWLDVNGDGLPDKLHNGGSVEFNLGYSFSPAVSISGLPYIINGHNISLSPSINFGFNNGNTSISGGMGVSLSRSLPEKTLQDINGDGLIDKIEISGNDVTFFINKGTSFEHISATGLLNQGSLPLNIPNNPFVDFTKWRTSFNASAGNSFGGNFTFGFVFGPIIPIFKAVFSPGINHSNGLGITLRQFYDINGDGYPDYLFSEKEGELKVQLSNIGKTNKLKSVSRPLGGSFKIDYAHNEATYDHPGGKWVMDSLTVYDGVSEDRLIDNGFDSKQSFTYKKGKYDRYEREFLGFGEIITNDLDFDNTSIRNHIQVFDNQNYYTANNLIIDRIEDGGGKKYVETENTYWHFPNAIGDKAKQGDDNSNISEFDTWVYSCPLKYSANNAYEGQPQKLILNESYYEYDELGNNTLFRYSNSGKMLESNTYDYETVKSYKPINLSNRIFGLVKYYIVKNLSCKFREGKVEYDDNTGVLSSESITLNKENEIATTQYQYDAFGNIVKKKRPDGFEIKLTYEPQLKTYVTKIEDKWGESTSEEFDYRFGIATKLEDINDYHTFYLLDTLFGRIEKVWAPFEWISGNAILNSPPTIEIIYDKDLSTLAHSKVVHKTIYDATEEIITHTYIDGNKRIIQTKKNAVIADKNGLEDAVNKWIASGKIIYDAIGRLTKQYYPCRDNKEQYDSSLIPTVITPTEFTYDILDRKTSAKLPISNSVSALFESSEYGVKNNLLFKSDTIYHEANIALNKISTDYYNGSGDKVMTELKHNTLTYTTTFVYYPTHELKQVIDNKGNQSTYEYDLKGRLVSQSSPDAGEIRFEYNLLGNKTAEILPNKLSIQYNYDKYDQNRLTEINYSENPQNNVRYIYGDKKNGNAIGRLYYKEDATGAEEYNYDEMGNISKILKTVVAPFDKEYTFETNFKYDSWNRIRSITYPDGDEVKYKYNGAGLLNQITSSIGHDDYVKNIGYDEFEQRSFIKYGNDVTTSYTYDDRRRVDTLAYSFTGGKNSQCIYKYDNQNNIALYSNISNLWSGDVTHTYNYNDLSQLTGADGSIGDNKYHVSYDYDDRFNLTVNKSSLTSPKISRTNNLSYSVNSKNNYIDSIIETTSRNTSNAELDKHYSDTTKLTFDYDSRGNNVQESKADLITKRSGINKRQIIFDEENRVSAISLNGFVSNYFYSDKGDRVVKLSTQTDNVYLNGQLSAEKTSSTSFSVYASPYFSTRNGGNLFSKHIYIGNERIVSELTNGNIKPEAECHPEISSSCNTISKIDYSIKKNILDEYINEVYDKFDMHHITIQPTGFATQPPLEYGSERNPSVNEAVIPIDVQKGLRYFYHTNQINSVNYISDDSGQVVQQIEYLPYGQVFLEQRKGYSSQFTFIGKEEDRESGLTYFGARYYDPSSSLWLSVDPMADKFQGLSPYNYCLGNPIKYFDPDGSYVEINEYGKINKIVNPHQSQQVKLNGASLGKLGGKIDANIFFNNLLKMNISSARKMNAIEFKNMVRGKQPWDLKNDMASIIGYANKFPGKTIFLFEGSEYNSADLGNFHFGATGKATNIFPEIFMLWRAGRAQVEAGTSKPEWGGLFKAPFGDDPRDQDMIIKGFNYFEKNKPVEKTIDNPYMYLY